MTNEIIKGSALNVWVNVNGTAKTIAFATNHTFNMTVNTIEVVTKDHGDYPGQLANNITWEITTENLYSTDNMSDLIKIAASHQPVNIEFAEVSDYNGYSNTDFEPGIVYANGYQGPQGAWTKGNVIASGKAIITSYSVNSQAGDNASISCTFTGSGALTVYNGGAQGTQGTQGTQGGSGGFDTGN